MNLTLHQLTSWKGEIARREYLIWGLILFGVKYNLDRAISLSFERRWFITDYFIQADKLSIQDLTSEEKTFFLILLLQSLPFIWFGTVLCIKRLRSASLPGLLVMFFFIPFVNLILFILLAVVPESSTKKETPGGQLGKLFPKSRSGAAMFSIGIVSLISLLMTGLLLNYLKEYGWSLFVGIPFFLGFGSVLFYGYHNPLKYKDALGVALTTILFFCLIIFILAFEGI